MHTTLSIHNSPLNMDKTYKIVFCTYLDDNKPPFGYELWNIDHPAGNCLELDIGNRNRYREIVSCPWKSGSKRTFLRRDGV